MKYKIIEVDGIWRACIDITGKPNKYGKPKIFDKKEDAERWIEKRSYAGMSFHYEIKEVKE